MIRYHLDTNIVFDLVRDPLGRVRQTVQVVGPDAIGISVIVAAEARFGAEKKAWAPLSSRLDAVLAELNILPIETPFDRHYARLRAMLERAGTPIGANDTMIAAHALALDCILVSDNERDFHRVPDLRVENWLRSD